MSERKRGHLRLVEDEPVREEGLDEPLEMKWIEEMQGVTTEQLRAGLEAVCSSVPRDGGEHLQREVVASFSGMEWMVTGLVWEPGVREVWHELLRIARQGEPGEPCVFTGQNMLRTLGRHTGALSEEWLSDAIAVAATRAIEVRVDGRFRAMTSLVRNYEGCNRNGNSYWRVRVGQSFAYLFGLVAHEGRRS